MPRKKKKKTVLSKSVSDKIRSSVRRRRSDKEVYVETQQKKERSRRAGKYPSRTVKKYRDSEGKIRFKSTRTTSEDEPKPRYSRPKKGKRVRITKGRKI